MLVWYLNIFCIYDVHGDMKRYRKFENNLERNLLQFYTNKTKPPLLLLPQSVQLRFHLHVCVSDTSKEAKQAKEYLRKTRVLCWLDVMWCFYRWEIWFAFYSVQNVPHNECVSEYMYRYTAGSAGGSRPFALLSTTALWPSEVMWRRGFSLSKVWEHFVWKKASK